MTHSGHKSHVEQKMGFSCVCQWMPAIPEPGIRVAFVCWMCSCVIWWHCVLMSPAIFASGVVKCCLSLQSSIICFLFLHHRLSVEEKTKHKEVKSWISYLYISSKPDVHSQPCQMNSRTPSSAPPVMFQAIILIHLNCQYLGWFWLGPTL